MVAWRPWDACTAIAFLLIASPTPHLADVLPLMSYRSYSDVTLFHFAIPEQVTEILWSFRMVKSKSSCPNPSATIYIRYGAYPVFAPDNATYPPNYLNEPLQPLYMPDNTSSFLHLTTFPDPGDWFISAVLDSKKDQQLTLQGLGSSCDYVLAVENMYIDSPVTNLIIGQAKNVIASGNVTYFRVFVTEHAISLRVKIMSSCRDCGIRYGVTLNKLPKLSNTSESVPIEIEIHRPKFEGVYYIGIVSVPIANVTLLVGANECPPSVRRRVALGTNNATKVKPKMNKHALCPLIVPMTRFNENQRVHFVLATGGSVSLVGLSDDDPELLLQIDVLPFLDTGSTMLVQLQLVKPLKALPSNESATIEAVLQYNCPPPSDCSNVPVTTVLLTLNDSNFEVSIPYPSAGSWYLRLQLVCYDSENNSEIACSMSYMVALIRVVLHPCASEEDSCGRYGYCTYNLQHHLQYSVCQCIAGWRGWGCTDGSNALSSGRMWASLLFLTLSNLVFVPVLVLSLIKRLYMESVVYCFTMLSSAFYHACDQPLYSYCLFKYEVLQFCDFYSAVFALWVTVLGLCHLPPILYTVALVIGVFIIMVATQVDMTSAVNFIIPTCIVAVLLITCWAFRCRKRRSCYPPKLVWLFNIGPGLLLAVVGLIIYAFFQTENNYYYLHSLWHITIGLAVLCVLPFCFHKSPLWSVTVLDNKENTVIPYQTIT